ncbi:zinc metalloprotease [Campylobacter sputorum subsp. bubulus]|uniref:Zinc metalloprotease n=1 Tax=Campylobacter sputorum subsp. sputorum TaxID=32024 RepID=A0A381DGK6_9BACT|nr:SprT family zinc-dependent metalloprotease [Campylobacter sputorum]ASM34907.1 DUF45 domain protein [Campylobacter sputorum aubsp. sputorum RM3237]KAB0581962.1 M48 family metallopeptidase [Campylobacter sputorum subsp. sputorum]QEL05098.1 peptidase, M48 family (DUF45 domain) [Campylobacter sputorum subsp. sputorum]SUX09380.1 zinc metalloprotease [Campylobacter sputorum subsp. sputorum]SUX30838.1 zinc metalloprotease [Campylobacter sputorum subsp. bubulus]
MAKQKTCINFHNFEIFITIKKIKYARLKVSKTGEISLNIPYNFNENLVYEMLNKHKEWLEKTLSKIKSNLLPKDKISFLGEIYNLKFDENTKKTEFIKDTLITKNEANLEKFLKQKAIEIFTHYINLYKPHIKKPINRICIRKMSTRWGSCNTKKGYINLNLNLIFKDADLIEYVILHELTHLIYPHHKKEFYEFIKNLMIDYKDREKRLR